MLALSFRLHFFRNLHEYRILVCGGDGTVGWLLDAIGISIGHTVGVKLWPAGPQCSYIWPV